MKNIYERIDFLTDKAKFTLSKEEKEKFINDLQIYKNSVKILDEFDLEGVQPIRHPFEGVYNIELREDIPETEEESKEYYDIIMKNSSETKDGYIFLKDVNNKKGNK